ncbi:MAG TPA: M20/M25/M40 family metallo-hydrolase [Vicinamibacteria bacterium]|nr:M20/M25/M40 family metallo-hydrolase [Vicinamibacteria bacterium]
MIALLLAASVSGEAALRHASRLAALGPHPWGSPRVTLAASYVESQFREAGLQEVRLQPFESHGLRGANVLGVLRGPGEEFVVVAAHHDTAPAAPGAYDDGGGVGVLIEAARALSSDKRRARTLVFASFDGEEAWSTGKTTVAGARAYVKALGADSRELVGAFVIEMCGWAGGTPAFQALAYADPLRKDGSVIAPRWLVEASARGARAAGSPLVFGDPLIPWLHQAAVRTWRASLYGDDMAFLQARLPAVFVTDSSFTRFYPEYHQPADTADRLDPAALERMARAVVGAVRAVEAAPRGGPAEPHWFAAFGAMIGATPLVLLGVAVVVPGVRLALRAGGRGRTARLLHALLFGYLLYRNPVPALYAFLLPNLLPLAPRRTWIVALSLLPAISLLGIGALAYARGFVSGTFLTAWDQAAGLGGLALALVPLGSGAAPPGPRGRKPRR